MSIRAAAIVLAAGNSSRMGRSKQLLDYRGMPLVRRAVIGARDAGFMPLVVVTGEKGRDVEVMHRALVGEPVEWVENSAWADGMGTTIRAGMRLVEQAEVDAVVLMVCDQPLVTAKHLRSLVAAMAQQGKTMAAAGYEGTIGIPAVIMREHFGVLASIPDGGGAKGILQKHRDAVAVLSLPEAAVDVDDEAAYRQLLERPVIEG